LINEKRTFPYKSKYTRYTTGVCHPSVSIRLPVSDPTLSRANSAAAAAVPFAESFGSNPNTTVTALCNSEYQGLTPVHFSAQLERFLWDRGCA